MRGGGGAGFGSVDCGFLFGRCGLLSCHVMHHPRNTVRVALRCCRTWGIGSTFVYMSGLLGFWLSHRVVAGEKHQEIITNITVRNITT